MSTISDTMFLIILGIVTLVSIVVALYYAKK